MPVDIVIPSVGESVSSGVIAAWHKADGDVVERDEVVLDLETDKVTMEVRAPAAGSLKRLAAEGDEVAIGAVVGRVDESAAGATRSAAPKKASVGSERARETGAAASTATEPPPQPRRTDTQRGESKRAEPAEGESTPSRGESRGEALATPLARKLADELRVDLSQVVGTGAGQRVREQDVLAWAHAHRGNGSPPPAPRPAGARESTRRKMSPLRQRVAARLVEAQRTAAMLTTFNECDMSAVIAMRTRYKERFEERHGVGLGFMSFFVTAACGALRAIPAVNAAIVPDPAGQPMIESFGYCDVAIAVASPKGLVVPVIRSAESLSFAQIEQSVRDLASRARDGKLTLDELQGGTFTITNGGVFGSLMSTPILNPPQAAILGLHAIKNRAVENPDRPGEVVLRPMMYLALSYDHRLVDGAEAVRFLVHIKDAIEHPERLLLDV